LEVIQKNSQSPGFLTKISDDSAGSTDSLLDTTFFIELGKSAPGTKVLSRVNHNDGDLSLSTKSSNKLFVLLVFTVLGETAETGGAAVEGLGTLMKAFAETIVDEGLLEYLQRTLNELRIGMHKVMDGEKRYF